MDSVMGSMLVIAMFTGQMGSPDFQVREQATSELIRINNDSNHCIDFITPFLLHSNPEITRRVKRVVDSYYNIRSTVGYFPKISDMQEDKINFLWLKKFQQAFNFSYHEDDCGGPPCGSERYDDDGYWWSIGDGEERKAAYEYVQETWQKKGLTRREAIAMIDEMVKNAEENVGVTKLPTTYDHAIVVHNYNKLVLEQPYRYHPKINKIQLEDFDE